MISCQGLKVSVLLHFLTFPLPDVISVDLFLQLLNLNEAAKLTERRRDTYFILLSGNIPSFCRDIQHLDLSNTQFQVFNTQLTVHVQASVL